MINNIKIEICTGSINDCLKAIKYPIDSIQLNSAIELGGLTPSVETLRYLKHLTNVEVVCTIKHQASGYSYSDAEFDIMYVSAYNLLKNGASGIVFGFLNHDNTINKGRTKMFVDLAHQFNAEAIFNDAFDKTNMIEAIDILNNLGVDKVLTEKGIDIIDKLKGHGILVVPSVKANNILNIINNPSFKQVNLASNHECYDSNEMDYGIDEDKLKELFD